MSRHCFLTNVKEGKLEEYLKRHDNIPPEVASGLRTAGVSSLVIYNLPKTNTIVMTIETNGDIDLGKALGPGSNYRKNEICKKWEEEMDEAFHGGWTEMTNVHDSKVQWNKNLGLS
eukprot:g1765.t1